MDPSQFINPSTLNTAALACFASFMGWIGWLWFSDGRPARKAKAEIDVDLHKRKEEAELKSQLAHAEFAETAKGCMVQQTDLIGRVVGMQDKILKDQAEAKDDIKDIKGTLNDHGQWFREIRDKVVIKGCNTQQEPKP